MFLAYFADLLWNKVWEVYPKQFCSSFRGKTHIKISESTIIKREVRSKEFDPASRFPSNSYDYVVDLYPLGVKRRLLFEIWRELLFSIPNKLADTYAVWYIVVNSTEDRFFDETAPQRVRNIEGLVDLVTSTDRKTTIIIKSDVDEKSLDLNIHKFLVVPIFNSTPAKGEARWEIKRLEEGKYDKLLMWRLMNHLLV